MTGIELYINNRLCDLDNPQNYSIYLKRVLINPSELSVKDAQMSYDISLPATATNNAIFGYTNTEEVRGKFALLYDAVLYAGGIKIMDGKFKISEISKDYYKGNLGVPAQKAIKDIFGETKMNEAGKWDVPFEDQTWMTKYNDGSATPNEIPPCIFPLVLYGLLPKKPYQLEPEKYTAKLLIDKHIDLKRDHFPPSINCLKMLQEIFKQKGLTLSGTAFGDERMTNLYVSYKNPPEYPLRWNYGKMGKVHIKGEWTNLEEGSNGYYSPEDRHLPVEYEPYDASLVKKIYAVDLFKSKNLKNTKIKDTGQNVVDRTDGGIMLTIPFDGLYKIRFKANIMLDRKDNRNYPLDKVYYTDGDTKIISAGSTYLTTHRYFNLDDQVFEVKLLRNKVNGTTFNLLDSRIDNVFYKNNINHGIVNNNGQAAFWFPQEDGVNFIDQAQNPNMLCGFSFGNNYSEHLPVYTSDPRTYCKRMAISAAKSWDTALNESVPILSATYSPPYVEVVMDGLKEISRKTTNNFFKVNLINTHDYTKYTAFMTREIDPLSYSSKKPMAAEGCIEQVVKLEKGEQLTIVGTSPAGAYYSDSVRMGWVRQHITYDLDISLFTENEGWIKIDEDGKSTVGTLMDWNDPIEFSNDQLDLMRFLPEATAVDEWIDNFCKSFNLDLIQLDAKAFELNTKQKQVANSSLVIDLDAKTNVDVNRKNNSLGLPSVYELGFTINKNEEGYVSTQDNGGGTYYTTSPENKKLTQPSKFSYNWFKSIKNESDQQEYLFPVITDKEIWEKESSSDYPDMMDKCYTDYPQRFWYRQPGNEGLFATTVDNGIAIKVAMVSGGYKGQRSMTLNYKEENASILRNYFTLFADAHNAYTTVECYLTPEEYSRVDASLARLNGDLYYIAEVDGYDPMCKKKSTLKLMRKFI